MFEALTDRLSGVFDKLTGRGALSEADVAQLLRSTTSDSPFGISTHQDEDLRLSVAGAQEKTALF